MSFCLRTLGCAVAALAMTAAAAFAQLYPGKPIRMIVPFPPGTATDVVARIVAQQLSQRLGQNIVVDNRPGADGAIGAGETVRATADGYTLLFGTNSPLAAVPAMRKKPPYHPLDDLTPIGRVGQYTHYVVAHPSVPAKSLGEFIEYARANPGKLTYATGNTFSILTVAQLQKVAGIKLLQVPYKGDPAAIIDVAAGRVQFMFVTRGQGAAFVHDRRVRALAVTGSKRFDTDPDLPTVAESGLKVPVLGWAALVGPAKLPTAVVQRLNHDLNAVLLQPKVIEEVSRQGFEPGSSTPAELTTMLLQQLEFWSKMARELNLQSF